MKNINIKNQNGMAAIFTVIVISAAALIMAKSVSFLSLGEIDMAFISDKSDEAYYLTEGCVEETLQRIRLDNNYLANNFSLPVQNGSCIIDVEVSAGQRVITALGILENFNKKIEVNLTLLNGGVEINSWEEK